MRDYCLPRTVYQFDLACIDYTSETDCIAMGHCLWTQLETKLSDGTVSTVDTCLSVAEYGCMVGKDGSCPAHCLVHAFCSDFKPDATNLCFNHLEQYCIEEYPLVSPFTCLLLGQHSDESIISHLAVIMG